MADSASIDEGPGFDILEIARNFIFLGAPIGLGMGCLHLYGFWQEFSVNVFQYAGVSDIVSTTLVPLILLVIINVVSSVFGFNQGQRSSASTTGNRTSQAKWDMLKVNGILLLVFLAALTAMAFFWSKKWLFIPVICYLLLVRVNLHKDFNLIRGLSSTVQKLGIFVAIYVFLQSYGLGVVKAKLAIEGDSYIYVVASNDETLSRKGMRIEEKFRFIGHVGDYDFFYDPTTTHVKIMKVQDENFLILGHYEREVVKEIFERLSKRISY